MDRKSCDVVVIGSGIGGLCVAARMSHAGYRCLVLERMPVPGGRYTYVDHKGYWMCTGAQMLAYGRKDAVLQTLRDVGVSPDFDEMKAFPGNRVRYRLGGRDHEISGGNALGQLLSIASHDKQEANKALKALRRGFTWQEPSDSITVGDWLRSVTNDQGVHDIIQYECDQILGVNPNELPAGELFRELKMFSGVESLVPKMGLKSVVDSLLKVVKNNRGELLKSTRVTRIVVEDGIARGVECKNRSGHFRIEAKVVVSNAGPKGTVMLAGEDQFDKGYLKDVRDLQPISGILFVLTSDGPLFESPGGILTTDTQRPHLWMDLALIWPDWAPKGKSWIYAWTTPLSGRGYDPMVEYKVFLADVAQTFPNFEAQNGEILLAKNCTGVWPAELSGRCQSIPHKTPVENLFNVGDGVAKPEFIAGSRAADSARVVAEEIKSRISA